MEAEEPPSLPGGSQPQPQLTEQRSEARDDEAGQSARVERANAHVFEAAEPDCASLRVVRGEHRQLGADREASEVLRLAANVHEARRNEAARDDLRAPEGRLQTRLQQRRLALDVQ